jgi:xanthine dehydrogenase large subunit
LQVTYADTDTKGLFSMEDAAAAGSFLIPPGAMKKEVGDADAAMKTAAHVVTGEFKTGGQSHFCMEKQTTIAVPGEQVCHYMTQPLVELYAGCIVVLKVS